MNKKNLCIRLAAICCITFWPVTLYGQNAEKVSELVNSIGYGVPTSPAFELLPEKPNEVTHLVSPKDVSSNVSNFLNGTKLRTGFAFDIRPFAYSVGSLGQYYNNPFKQVLWRSVLSVGTSPAEKGSNDAFLSAGLRIPIIDRGDPRASEKYITQLTDTYAKAVEDLGQPPFDMTLEELQRRSEEASKPLEPIRKEFLESTWNALKVDAGLALMWRAKSSDIKPDSLMRDRIGGWVAAALPISKKGQLVLSGKSSWIVTNKKEQETSRYVTGARIRFYLTEWLSASIEGARIWSRYEEQVALNEEWTHFAGLVELKMPIIGGWLGVAYGGDTPRRENMNSKFGLTYAVYADRIIKK